MMAVIGIIALIFIVVSGALIGRLYSQVRARQEGLNRNLQFLRDQQTKKTEILEEIGKLALGLSSPAQIENRNKDLVRAEDEFRAEQGRITITQAELEAIETRLRELEEIERELEASSIEAGREVEMLRSQERDVKARNEALRAQLESSFLQIDALLAQLQNSSEAQEKLTRFKNELLETQEKINWYADEIARLNEKYVVLKRAYDAIDIEYAQLYEKHNALEAAAARQ